MKILSLTAGAAGMYCGSCFRDNALAAELKRQGHDAVLVPIYTPTVTDEQNVSEKRVFFGGISVYLQQKSPLFAHTPALLDAIWDSRWALKMAAKSSIPVDPKLLGELTVSMLQGENGRQTKELRKLIAWLRTEPLPDIISLPYTLLIGLAKPLREALGAPVCCAMQGEDLFLEGLREPYRSRSLELIRENAQYVDAFLPVSRYYSEFMAGYLGIPEEKMHIVPLGANLEGYDAKPKARGDVFTIGYFARIDPAKGLHVLVDAYKRLRARPDAPKCRLVAAGFMLPEHKAYLAGIEAPDFRYLGVLDREEKVRFLQSLDVLSVPSVYAEPKGMYLLEAMANGTPVVQPRRGAFPEIIEATGGGLLVPPDDPEALADGLLSIWRNPAIARQLSESGVRGVREHFGAARMAARALEVYESICAEARRNHQIVSDASRRN
jgi:glycosyltransferase involved in cell wall biosynthesis